MLVSRGCFLGRGRQLEGGCDEFLALQALALQAQGVTAQALTTLGRTLALANLQGYVRLFVDEGAPMGEFTATQRAVDGPVRTYITTLVDQPEGIGPATTGSAPAETGRRAARHGARTSASAVASMDSAAWNGRFGKDIVPFNAMMAARAWTQDQTALRWALPRYQAQVDAALARQIELRAVQRVRAVSLVA
jgi:hypothetical protein